MYYEPDQNATTSRRVPAGLSYLSPIFLLLCLHFMGSLSPGQSIKAGRNASSEDREAKLKRESMAPAFKMLKAKGVPFDPTLLIDDDWRSRIEPTLDRMPEMGQTVRVTEPMEGVYLAGILLLPEHISLKGDTFILTRELAPEDENSRINITGAYRLFIFNIGDSRKYEAMARKPPPDQFLNINVEDSLVIVGIAPMYLGTYRSRGNGFFDWRRPN